MRTSFPFVIATAAATLSASLAAPTAPIVERNFGTVGYVSKPTLSGDESAYKTNFFAPGSDLPFQFVKGASQSGTGPTEYSTTYVDVLLQVFNEDATSTNHTLAQYLTSSNTSSTIDATFYVPQYPHAATPAHMSANAHLFVHEYSVYEGHTYVKEYTSYFDV
ncbi:hypothetical protein OIO90_000135 [Microbotryomycetes sp. JL221]|nr:hypothetical protein OIO90_000135 [Microbotryomycetes sp. JL221]